MTSSEIKWIRPLTAGLLFLIFACTVFQYSEKGIGIDVSELTDAIVAEADRRSSELIANSETLDRHHPLYIKAELILQKTIEGYVQYMLKLNEESDGMLELLQWSPGHGNKSYEEILRERYKYLPRLTVLVQYSPLAIAYPKGALFVTRGLIDPDSFYSSSNEAQMTGILAQELLHLIYGHVDEQWFAIKSRQKVTFKKALSALVNIFPFLKHEYDPGKTYEDIPRLVHLFKYQADRQAIHIMEILGHDRNEYLDFLTRLKIYRDNYATSSEEPYGWIDGRIASLHQLCSPTPAKLYIKEYSTEWKKYQKKVVSLSAEDQYNLPLIADLYFNNNEWKALVYWLKEPDERYLNEVVSDFQESSKKRISGFMEQFR